MYIAGSIFYVKYKFDGIIKEEEFILVETFEKDKLFQIVAISGYYAGMTEGYIPYQFEKERFCSFEHLKKELEIWVYEEVLNLQEVKPIYAQHIDWKKLGY